MRPEGVNSGKPVKSPLDESQHTKNGATEETDREEFYKAAIGPAGLAFYLKSFGLHNRGKIAKREPEWNWPAFFITGPWLLYRKLYAHFFIYVFVASLVNVFSALAGDIINFLCVAMVSVAYAAYANRLYKNSIDKKIEASANKAGDDRLAYLKKVGGVNNGVAWGVGCLFLIGVTAAIAIPTISGDGQRTGTNQQASPGQGLSRLENTVGNDAAAREAKLDRALGIERDANYYSQLNSQATPPAQTPKPQVPRSSGTTIRHYPPEPSPEELRNKVRAAAAEMSRKYPGLEKNPQKLEEFYFLRNHYITNKGVREDRAIRRAAEEVMR